MKSHASMNRIYRLVFNAALGIWVAVAENAKGRGKGGRAASALIAVLAILSPSAYAANAADATLRAGTGTVATVGNTTTVNQTSQRMALDWTQLSTAANEALKFNQPNAQAIALNRITGSSPSTLLGSLSANGQVFILNPNGILFGAGSQVNVGGLVASTLGMNPIDFMNGSKTFTKTSGTGSVVNQGTMTATQGGYLALLAPEVRNEGVMTASLGTALLAAGNKVTLNLDNGSLLGYSIDQGAVNALADNKQLIKADGGQVLLGAKALDALTTAAVNNTGVIEAHTVQNIAGRIMLMGDMARGTVNVGGTLDASASQGNGGFIETSAATVNVANNAKVTTQALNGKTGTWLIDPVDFVIAATGGNITGAAMGTALATNNMVYSSAQGTAGVNGDVLVNDSVSWSANNSLTLNAQRNIDFTGGGSLNASGATSAVNLTAGQGGAGAIIGHASNTVVTANTLVANAQTGIGSIAAPLLTRVANAALTNSTSGGVYMTNTGDLTLAASSTNGDVVLKFSDGVAGATGATGTGISVNGSGGTGGTGATGGNLTVSTVAGLVGIKTVQAGNITLSAGRGGNGGGGGDALSSNYGSGGSGGNGGTGGGIIFNAAITGQSGVTLNAGSGGVGGPVTGRPGGGTPGVPPPPPSCGGSGQPLCPLMQVGAVGTQGTFTGTGIDITAGTDLSLNSAIAATSGNVNLAAGTGINNGAGGALRITGANAVTLANSTSGLVSVDAGAAPVTVLAAGVTSSSTQLVTTGDITLQGSINATGAGNAIRLAGRNFTNNAGAAALTAAGGRYLVWSQTPVNNSFGGLMSGNAALWGTAYNPASPTAVGTGNQFIFAAAQPNGVGIVKADNKTKTYGDVFAPASFTYTAFAGDSGASYGNAFTDVGGGVVTLAGAPAFASTGALATATRTAGNGGGASYDITVDLTGVTAAGFTLQGAKGLLTVNARSLNLSGSRSYDGSSNIAGSALVAGNSVNGDGTALVVSGAGTVASKNVGTGKAVNTAGLSLAGAAAANYTLTGGTAVADITQASLTVTAQAVTKTYDGTTTAAGNGVVGTLAGAGAGESINTAATQAFLDKNAGAANKTVRASGLTVKDAGNADVTSNYAISYADNTTSTITPKALTVSGITAANKVYDQGAVATVSTAGATYGGLIVGDVLNVSTTGAFTDKNAANGKTVTLTSGYLGADVGNYAITNQASTTANITQKALTVSGITAANKVYDQTTAATVSTAGATYGGLIVGDVLNVSTTGAFTDKNAANGKTVTLTSGYTGADVGNYAITNQATTAANITQKALTVSGLTGVNKVYDRSTAATVNTAGAAYSGLIAGDAITVSSTGTFSDKNVANGKAVTLASSYTGADAGNYAITNQAATTANITQRALTVTATPDNKVYDGTTVASVSYADNRVAGDALTFTSTANFADKNAANNIAVTVSTVTPGGADTNNYTVGTIAVASTANITRRALAVTANDDAHQGGTPYSGGNGVTYKGFVAGEGAAVLAGTVGYSGSSQGASNGGFYDITPGGQTASNYSLSYLNGVLLVKSADAVTAALGTTDKVLIQAYKDAMGALAGLSGGGSGGGEGGGGGGGGSGGAGGGTGGGGSPTDRLNAAEDNN